LKRSISSTRLGDLLVQAGILTQAQLGEAVRNAKAKGIQVGQALVMNGVIAPRDLQSALDAQSMIRDKTVDMSEALRCLKIGYKVGASFKDILNEYASPRKTQTSKLGEILVESGLISYEVLARAVEQSNTTGLPLGRMLVLHQTISNELLTTALDLQVRVRDEMLTREEAIQTLRKMAGLSPDVPTGIVASVAVEPPRRRRVRLGELMVMAGVLTETDVMNALEWGLVNHTPIGKVLISQKLVSENILETGLAIQKLVDKEGLEPVKGGDLLARVYSRSISLDDALAELKAEEAAADKEISYERLLTLARVLDDDELEDAFDMSTKSSAIIGKVLVLTGHIDVPTLQATLRCHQLLSRGHLSSDDAVVTLDYCLHHNPDGVLKFDDALKELGWSKGRGLRFKGESGTDLEGSGEGGAGVTVGEGAVDTENENDDSLGTSTSDQVSTLGSRAMAAREEAAQGTQTSAAAQTEEDAAKSLGTSGGVQGDDVDANTSVGIEPDVPAQAVGALNVAALAVVDDNPEDYGDVVQGASEVATTQDGLAPITDEASDAGSDEAKPKVKKHNITIQPADARATRLASLVKGPKDTANSVVLANLEASQEPPDALQKVFERLANSYFVRGNYPQAQVIYERILVHRLNEGGAEDVALFGDLHNLAGVLVAQEKYSQAEPFMRRALTLIEKNEATEPRKVADALSVLATIAFKQERFAEAESLLTRALALRQMALPTEHPDIAQTYSDFAKVLRKLGREKEAEDMYRESLVILSKLETTTGDLDAITDKEADEA
jgi:tetratricopeptide (TPR) repeat protein